MVTDQTVCSRVSAQWKDGGLFDVPYANLIVGMCVKYMRKYGKPPGNKLRNLVDRWAVEGKHPDELVRMVESFLEVTSDEYEHGEAVSSDYMLDVTERYFDRVRVRKAIEEAENELDAGRVADARRRLTSITPVELGTGLLIRASQDYLPWVEAWDEDRQRPLVEYPDEAEIFFNGCWGRGDLIAYQAPDKAGKSFWLLDLAYRSVKARCKVAFFDVGDNNRDEVIRRLAMRVLRQPKRNCTVLWPVKMRIDRETGAVQIKTEQRQLKGVTPQKAFKTFQKICRGRDSLRISCHPNSSVSVEGVAGLLKDWAREGWIADAVIIDYVDILAPPAGVRDKLDQIEATWKQLRRLSQELHCLVVTATQSSAKAYADKPFVMGRSHFSGRKTKLAEVVGMIGLQVTASDRDKGISRLNWIVRRNARYSERRQLVVAGCLDVACPMILAKY